MATAELLGRDAKRRAIDLPSGWTRVTTGPARRGDRYWHWGDESWRTVEDSHTFLGIYVEQLQCVIRREEAASAHA